jgi:succinyl-CoA synthetase beta subunit
VNSSVQTVAQVVADATKIWEMCYYSATIVRLQGTNAAIAKELIDNSGMPIHQLLNLQEADQVKAALS